MELKEDYDEENDNNMEDEEDMKVSNINLNEKVALFNLDKNNNYDILLRIIDLLRY